MSQVALLCISGLYPAGPVHGLLRSYTQCLGAVYGNLALPIKKQCTRELSLNHLIGNNFIMVLGFSLPF